MIIATANPLPLPNDNPSSISNKDSVPPVPSPFTRALASISIRGSIELNPIPEAPELPITKTDDVLCASPIPLPEPNPSTIGASPTTSPTALFAS